jgi:general secretion pathway protein J
MRRARDGEAGFTLIEALLALTIFGMLMAMLLGGVHVIARGYDKGSRQAERWTQIPIIADFLREEAGDARLHVPTQSGDESWSFLGAADHVAFAGLLPAHFAVGGLQTIFIGPDETPNGHHNLVLRWEGYRADALEKLAKGLPESDSETVLIEHVAAVEFAYFGAAEAGGEPSWQQAWPVQDGGPSLLRLRVRLDDGTVLPELVAALRDNVP